MSPHKLPGLQLVTHPSENASFEQQAEAFCKAGGKWVQLRAKNVNDEEMIDLGHKLKQVCLQYNAILTVDDRPEIARAILADGLHLGLEDIAPDEARKILGDHYIIGRTANTFEDLMEAHNYEVDYIGLGPLWFTSTKKKLSPVLGYEGVCDIIAKYRGHVTKPLPVIVIGGVQPRDWPALNTCHVHGIAVSSGIVEASEMESATQQYLNNMKKDC